MNLLSENKKDAYEKNPLINIGYVWAMMFYIEYHRHHHHGDNNQSIMLILLLLCVVEDRPFVFLYFLDSNRWQSERNSRKYWRESKSMIGIVWQDTPDLPHLATIIVVKKRKKITCVLATEMGGKEIVHFIILSAYYPSVRFCGLLVDWEKAREITEEIDWNCRDFFSFFSFSRIVVRSFFLTNLNK